MITHNICFSREIRKFGDIIAPFRKKLSGLKSGRVLYLRLKGRLLKTHRRLYFVSLSMTFYPLLTNEDRKMSRYD